MIIQIYDVDKMEYVTEFEVKGDITDAVAIADSLTNYVHESVEYERANESITYNLDINVLQIQVKEIG